MALSDKDKKGVALMAGVAVVLLAIVGVKLAIGNGPKPDSDGCVGGVTSNTVIVLDHSQQVSVQTREEIVARAMSFIKSKVQRNERVTMFTVSELSKKSLTPVFSRCKPPEDGNRAYEDVRAIEKRFKRDFIDPAQAALAKPPQDSSESPLAQALIDISLSQYLRGDRNSLIVFSDMLENTKKFSLYKCSVAPESVARFRESRKGALERPKFRNTSVSLNMIPRTDVAKSTLKCRDQVWEWFFGDNEGSRASFEVDYLPGA
jgi:hypothetical protein